VVEGCGANGCEYMTGGTVIILGPVGDNFAAGMTGGMAFVYDEYDALDLYINDDSVLWQRIATQHWEGVARSLIEQHYRATQSRFAERVLRDWDLEMPKFWQIVPNEIVPLLQNPILPDDIAEKRA
jgi:glutamate synthase (NADPH/NADH) large chain